ncbi:hypothetical protein [Hydrogenimonas sp. SS33]|uniref:hypothetical protein n=1 Tax=Hydrogenimonas leucolamina TaxID=2954236 RepID=UPI00336BEB15
MKKTCLLILGILALQNSMAGCGCGKGKLMLQCDYYVARLGDKSRQHLCEEYAKVVDIDGASAQAAWYYLLAGKPGKALAAARRAYDQGQTYAAGYMAEALLILGRDREAKRYRDIFVKRVKKRAYFDKEIEVLKKLYPRVGFSTLR